MTRVVEVRVLGLPGNTEALKVAGVGRIEFNSDVEWVAEVLILVLSKSPPLGNSLPTDERK